MKVEMHGCFKGMRGKLGDLIFYMVGDEVYVRTQGERDEKNYSSEYFGFQERMSSVSILFRAIQSVALFGIWQAAAKERGSKGYNLFVKHNIYAFTDEGVISDFSKLRLTVGSLELPDRMRVERSGPDEWTLTWEQLSWHSAAREGDRLRVLMMEGDGEVFTVECVPIAEVCRSECRAVICRPPEYSEYRQLYCYFASADEGSFSESKHFELEAREKG